MPAAEPAPRWRPETDASPIALPSAGRSAAGTARRSGRVMGLAFASATATRAAGERRSGSRRRSSSAEKPVAITSPKPATPSSAAMRPIALLTPDAAPAFRSSASASTTAVCGATTIDSPSANTVTAGSSSAT